MNRKAEEIKARLDRACESMRRVLLLLRTKPARMLLALEPVSLWVSRSALRPRCRVIYPGSDGRPRRPLLVAGFLYFSVIISLPRK